MAAIPRWRVTAVTIPAVAELTLPDGRRLGFDVLGDPDGFPLIVLHGTPGSARQVAGLAEAARERGVAMIAPDRAGYGRSSFDRAGTIASGARDLGELLGHLNLSGCAVVGLSGGGPTALACGALLAGPVVAVATVGGVGPLVPRDPRLPPDRLLIRAVGKSRVGARALFAAIVRTGRNRPELALRKITGLMAEPDARLLGADGPVRTAFLDDLRHASPTTARAVARDFWLFSREWDIDLSHVSVPADVWHGTADRNVPVAHARVIADRCPAARLHTVEGGGHLLIGQLDQIIAGLRPGGG